MGSNILAKEVQREDILGIQMVVEGLSDGWNLGPYKMGQVEGRSLCEGGPA